jgi:putative Holliday junction resolvase
MGRVVAIDFGEKRIGLAASDLMKSIAFPFKTVEASYQLEKTLETVTAALKEKMPIDLIVVGLPLMLSGQDSPMSIKAKAFGEALALKMQTPVVFWDERLTSKQVENNLREQKMNRKERAKASDVLAAQLILESYLNKL